MLCLYRILDTNKPINHSLLQSIRRQADRFFYAVLPSISTLALLEKCCNYCPGCIPGPGCCCLPLGSQASHTCAIVHCPAEQSAIIIKQRMHNAIVHKHLPAAINLAYCPELGKALKGATQPGLTAPLLPGQYNPVNLPFCN